jgi:hypothetical protein
VDAGEPQRLGLPVPTRCAQRGRRGHGVREPGALALSWQHPHAPQRCRWKPQHPPSAGMSKPKAAASHRRTRHRPGRKPSLAGRPRARGRPFPQLLHSLVRYAKLVIFSGSLRPAGGSTGAQAGAPSAERRRRRGRGPAQSTALTMVKLVEESPNLLFPHDFLQSSENAGIFPSRGSQKRLKNQKNAT